MGFEASQTYHQASVINMCGLPNWAYKPGGHERRRVTDAFDLEDWIPYCIQYEAGAQGDNESSERDLVCIVYWVNLSFMPAIENEIFACASPASPFRLSRAWVVGTSSVASGQCSCGGLGRAYRVWRRGSQAEERDDAVVELSKLFYRIEKCPTEFEAIPATDDQLNRLEATGVSLLTCGGGEPCSGEYVCGPDGYRYRCMLDSVTRKCRWYKTNEPC